MISYIIGDVKYIDEESLVIENNGIGYRVFCSTRVLNQISTMESLLIYTEMIVREDELALYGFLSRDEKKMFDLLTGVSSIGPKNALRILSALSLDQIKYAIDKEDTALLCEAPGVGKKTASRIILELKDKVDRDYHLEEDAKDDLRFEDEKNYVMEALINLGYNRADVMTFLRSCDDGQTAEMMIKQAMKALER